jgi:hypothetical protein
MFLEFKTTITHKIQIGEDGIADISHDIDVEAGVEGGVLGATIIQSIVRQGCVGAIDAIDKGEAEVFVREVTDKKAKQQDDGSN